MQLSRATGWFPWIPYDSRDIAQSPYGYLQVELSREEWDATQTVDPRALDPLTNVVDLWWRPASPALYVPWPLADAALVYESWVLRKEGRDDTDMIARLAYEAYMATYAPKIDLPVTWEDLPELVRLAWAVVVRTVRLHA